ncbi:MAG TPA: cupredoxin domain-containing protein [Actinomycetota bacterium]|nr:cupredoxin domain-containing protein [Actinomycetota bacterium]
MDEVEVVAEARPPEDGGVAWVELLRWSVIAGVVVIALVNLFAGVIPPLIVFGLLMIGGLAWLQRATKGPAILLLVVSVAHLALSAPFTFPSFAVPASAGDFILNLAGVLAGLVAIVAAIAVLRGSMGVSPAPRSIARAAVAVFLVGTAISVFSTVTYDSATAQEGDIELATKSLEFSDNSLQATAGEVAVFVDNQDSTLHTFTIDELDVSLDVPGSKSARVTFDAEPGEYEFFCEPHKEDMKGTLVVE